MCLEFYFTYANFITIGEPLSYYIYIYMKTIIVISRKINQKIEFNFKYAVQILLGSVNKYVTSIVTSRGDVIIKIS